jgi:hypothetical protein
MEGEIEQTMLHLKHVIRGPSNVPLELATMTGLSISNGLHFGS